MDYVRRYILRLRTKEVHLHVLVEEVEEQLVGFLVVGLDRLILQITASGHETMDLVGEPLNGVLGLDCLLPLLDVLLRLILRRQHDERDLDAGSIVGVDHGRVARGSGLECSAFLRAQVHNLASPAVADDAPLFDARALAFDLLQDLGDALKSLGWRGLGVEELAELLALVVVVRRVPGDVSGLAVEEVLEDLSVWTVCWRDYRERRSPGMNTWY